MSSSISWAIFGAQYREKISAAGDGARRVGRAGIEQDGVEAFPTTGGGECLVHERFTPAAFDVGGATSTGGGERPRLGVRVESDDGGVTLGPSQVNALEECE